MPGMDKDEFMALLQDRIETRSIALLDMDNLGALDPANIGKLRENKDVEAAKQQAEA